MQDVTRFCDASVDIAAKGLGCNVNDDDDDDDDEDDDDDGGGGDDDQPAGRPVRPSWPDKPKILTRKSKTTTG